MKGLLKDEKCHHTVELLNASGVTIPQYAWILKK